MPKRLLAVFMTVMIVLSIIIVSRVHDAYAADSQLSDNTDWVRAYASNNQNDYLMDQQTGSGSVSQDIAGDETYPSTFMRLSSTEIAFRIRVNDINGADPYSFKNFAFVGIDADVNGSVDFFLGIYNPTGNNGRLGIYGSASGYTNMGPSTTGISGKPLLAFKPVSGVNYALTQADSNFCDTPDYFVSFKFSVSDIAKALEGSSHTFTASTPFRFITGTAAQDNSFNQDINGMDKSGWSSGSTWSSLGVFTDIVTADGSKTYYTVTFDKNTGDTDASPAVMAVEADQPLGSLPAQIPTKRGMYFQGWNTVSDGTGEMVTSNTIISGNTTFYALWSATAVYTVTFNPNGGNFSGSTNPITLPTINGVIGDYMPNPPTQTNKYFTGWLIEGTSNFFNSATLVTSNINVFAQWASNASKVAVFYDNYDESGGSEVARVYSNGNSNNFNGTLPDITRPGYTFGGWYLNDPACSGTAVTDISSQGNYYAKWTPANYTVTFDENYSGSPDATTKEITGGILGDLPQDPVRAGYEFIEWNRSPDATGEAMFPSSLISSNTSVYAIWELIQNVTFYANNGEFDDGSTQWSTEAIDGKLELFPQPPSRDGYTFLGWSTSSGSQDLVSLLDVTGVSELYAVWSPVKTVTFNENYGASPTTTNILTAYGSVLYLPEDPVRTHYDFIEWNTEHDGSGTSFTLSTNVSDDMIVYAMWELSDPTYTVSFETNGGSSIPDQVTGEITDAPVSVRDGYILEGWYTDADLTNKVSFPYTVTGDITLYAKWAARTYTVTLDPASGSGGTSSVTATFGQPMPAATAPARTGYTFSGYYDSSDKQYYDGDMHSTATWDKTENATLFAQWSPNTYAVTFDANYGQYANGDAATVIGQVYGSKYVLPSDEPARNGYTFAGWNTQADGAGDTITADTVVTITAPQRVYAVWTELDFVTIRYASNNYSYGTVSRSNESLNPQTGTALGSTAIPQPGYEFVKWTDERNRTVSTNAAFVPSKGADNMYTAATYTAEFREMSFPVTVNLMIDLTAIEGHTIKLTRDGGKTFFILVEQPDHTYSGDLPNGVYAIWVDDTDTGKTITIDGGEVTADVRCHLLTLVKGVGISAVSGEGVFVEGSTVPALAATVEAGYTWSKWVSSDTSLLADQTAQGASFKMPAGSVTLTAAAAPITHVITATAGENGSISPSGMVTVDEGASQTFVITPDKGYAISDVKVDGKSIGARSSFTFANITGNHTISAVFGYMVEAPQTGDRTPLEWLLVTMGLAIAGIAVSVVQYQKNKQKNQ